MQLPRLFLFYALPACLIPGLLMAAAAAPAPGSNTEGTQYTIQPGDTLTRIARKFGLTPETLARVNALDNSQRIMAGNVLRLPVTPPEHQTVAVQESPAVQSPGKPSTEAAPQQSAPVPATAPVPAAPLTPAPAAKLAEPTKAEAPVPPPAQVPDPEETASIPDSPAKLAAGVYTNSVLGTLRISQTATGISMTKDNQTIPMRHLLYGIFDGSDSTGAVHGLRLEFADNGQVTSLLYSTSTAKDIRFTRAKK